MAFWIVIVPLPLAFIVPIRGGCVPLPSDVRMGNDLCKELRLI